MDDLKMDMQTRTILKDNLKSDEGYRSFIYKDINGYASIGYGRCIDERVGRGISIAEADQLLDNDIFYFTNKLLQAWPYFSKLNNARQMVLINLCFNLGVKGLLEFKKMLRAIIEDRWEDAQSELLNSRAARQLSTRYARLGEILRTGKIISIPDRKAS